LNEYDDIAYVAFPSFHKIKGSVIKERKHGKGSIQTNKKVFYGCLRGNDDQPVLVHQGALKLLLHIMGITDFQTKVNYFMFQDRVILDS